MFLGLSAITLTVPFWLKSKSALLCPLPWVSLQVVENVRLTTCISRVLPIPGEISARHREGEITSPETVPLPVHILTEAEEHTNASFLVVHLEFSLRWSSAEFPLEYPNLYLVSNSGKKGNLPQIFWRGGAGLGATSS